MKEIPFNRPFLAGTEVGLRPPGGRGREASPAAAPSPAAARRWLAETTGAERALLSHSGTGALEAAMMLAELGPGDEAIMPSFAYPTMATAVVRQGATPVFVDVDPATLNLDPARVRGSGRAADQGDRRRALRRRRLRDGGAAARSPRGAGATLIEDAAHCLLASYGDRAARLDRRPRHAQLPPHQEPDQRRGRRPPRQRPGAAASGRRSSGRRAPTASASSAARSIATPGSTSAPPSRPAS